MREVLAHAANAKDTTAARAAFITPRSCQRRADDARLGAQDTTDSRASQCSLCMNFSGSSVMPPHSTMKSGHSSACIFFEHQIN